MTAPRKKAAPKPVSLRDRLAKKRAKIVTEYFALDEDGEKAIEQLATAQKLLDMCEAIKARDASAKVDLGELKQKRDEAAAERNKTCLKLQFRGLSEDAQDALASEYIVVEELDEDASAEDKKASEKRELDALKEWTFHAMAETVVDSDLSAEEWREELTSGRWTLGDITRIRGAIQSAYGSQPADGIPKG